MTTPEQQYQIDLLKDIFGLIKSLRDESERAVVILAAARLDVDLEKLLKHILKRHPGGTDPLFEGDRMLGTFSAKIAMAHRLGAIDDDFEHAIQMLRKIRNDFAHQLESEKLSSNRQKSRLQELVRWASKSDMYQTGLKAIDTEEMSVEHLQLVLCVATMVVMLHSGLSSLSRVHVGMALSVDRIPKNEQKRGV